MNSREPTSAVAGTKQKQESAAFAARDIAHRTDGQHPCRIVIVGGGFGGAYAAQRLERLLRPDEARITLIDRQNYFVFTPLLLEAGTGSLEPRHTVVPLRAFVRRASVRMADVTGIDPEARTLTYHLAHDDEGREHELPYDHLVFAPGSVTRLPEVPGLREHGFQIKTLADAVAMRDRAIGLMEMADATDDSDERRALLHLVVVGGNFTGAEVAGEFDMFLRQASREYTNVRAEDCRVTLVELADRILAPLGRELSEYAAAHLRRRGVDVRQETTVDRVERDHVTLSTGETLRARTVIWCAGIEPSPLVATTPFPTDERGYVRCRPDLRVEGHDNVWSIGDCAVNPDPEGNPYPATAQHAVGQGRHLAQNLARVVRGGAPTPCVLRSKGTLAALGCRTAVARVGPFKLAGFPAWWLWRTVYLLKMPTLGRKVRVAIDWTIALLFPRDYVQLGVHQVRQDTAQATKRER